MLAANLSPIKHLSLTSIVDAIPLEWRQLITQNVQHVPPYMGDNSEVTLSKVSSKLLFKAFKSRNKFLQRPKKGLRRNFHIFRFTGRIFTLWIMDEMDKLLDNYTFLGSKGT